MTNNFDRAREIIAEGLSEGLHVSATSTATQITHRLVAAGLLAPNLPKPTIIHGDGRQEWELTNDEDLCLTVKDGSILLGGKPLHPLVVEALSDNLRAALVELFTPTEEEDINA